MKLVDLIPINEIDFSNQKAFDAYNKKHALRPDTKVTIAGKPTTAGKASQNSKSVKGTSVFGNSLPNTSQDLKKVYKDLRDKIDTNSGDGAELKPRLYNISRSTYTKTSNTSGEIYFTDSDDTFVIQQDGDKIKVTKKRQSPDEISKNIKDGIKQKSKGGPWTVVARRNDITRDGKADPKAIVGKSYNSVDDVIKSFNAMTKKYGTYSKNRHNVTIEDSYGKTVYQEKR